jgi:uncharacterized membrane protein
MTIYLKERVQAGKLTSWLGLSTSLLALIAAFIIMVEKVHLLANPDYVTSCSLNAIISCSPVMSSPQAAAFFGIPNPLLGIAGFGVTACIYFLSFFMKLPRFVWVINTVGTALALMFCLWLSTQALFVINALCLYCFIVWMMTTVMFWYSLKPVIQGTRVSGLQFWVKLGAMATVATFLVMIFTAFSDYWLSLL